MAIANQCNYTHLNANGTTVLGGASTSPGQGWLLHTVTINTKGASSNTLTITDKGNGNVIAVIDTTAGVQTLTFDAMMAGGSGIQCVLATGTAADVTVSWL